MEPTIQPDSILRDNLTRVRDAIDRAASRSHRLPSSVRLVAVTKSVGPGIISGLARLGVRDVGENRTQVATTKMEQIPDPLDWHLIGHLQANKSGRAVRSFPWIHAIDSPKLFDRVRSQAAEIGVQPRLLLQVNVSGEASKHGFSEEELLCFLKGREQWPLPPVGLMTMAPFSEDAELARPVFRRLRELRDQIVADDLLEASVFTELSMGMTDDFEVAVEEGATLVRVGRALFDGLAGDEGD